MSTEWIACNLPFSESLFDHSKYLPKKPDLTEEEEIRERLRQMAQKRLKSQKSK
jgi:hypothetical protein